MAVGQASRTPRRVPTRRSVLGHGSQLMRGAGLDRAESVGRVGRTDETQSGIRHVQPSALFRFIAGVTCDPLALGRVRAIFVIFAHGASRARLLQNNRRTFGLFHQAKYGSCRCGAAATPTAQMFVLGSFVIALLIALRHLWSACLPKNPADDLSDRARSSRDGEEAQRPLPQWQTAPAKKKVPMVVGRRD